MGRNDREILSFKDMYGHLNITSNIKIIDLYEWVLYKNSFQSQLYQFQINQLNSLKFNWYDHRAHYLRYSKLSNGKRLSEYN